MDQKQKDEINNRIMKVMKLYGIDQQHLAAKLGLTKQAVSGWFAGGRLIKTENLADLAAVLGVTTDYILIGKTMGYKEIRMAIMTAHLNPTEKLRLLKLLVND